MPFPLCKACWAIPIRQTGAALVGPLYLEGGSRDARLLSVHEHVVLCLNARAAGRGVYLEPASVIRYSLEGRLRPSDLPYIALRWSDDWTARTLEASLAFGNNVDQARLTPARIRASLGDDVERLVADYHAMPWNLATHPALASESRFAHGERADLLLLRLANELDDHLDCSMAYCSGERRRMFDRPFKAGLAPKP